MAEVVRLRLTERLDFERWQEFVESRPDSHCTDLAEWRLLYHELYGFQDYSFLCLERGEVTGALSLYRIDSPFLGRMLLTCPFFGYGGIYWQDDAARDALLERAYETARELGLDFVEFRSAASLPSPYRANTDFSEFNLELGATPEESFSARLHSNARQNIRKARKHELEFRLNQSYGPCYGLLRRTLRAHGTPFHGEEFFRLLTRHLGERVRFSEVWHRDRLIAGGVVIRYKNSIITPYIGSLFQDRALRPNYLQYWGLIEHCHEVGVTRFEMGRSPRDSTHARFKEKWGCDELPLSYSYRLTGSRKGYRSVSQPSGLERLATRVWKRLPLAVTGIVGPRLFRYIP